MQNTHVHKNKYKVLIAGAQIHIIWVFALFAYFVLFVFLLFSDAPYIALWYIAKALILAQMNYESHGGVVWSILNDGGIAYI